MFSAILLKLYFDDLCWSNKNVHIHYVVIVLRFSNDYSTEFPQFKGFNLFAPECY